MGRLCAQLRRADLLHRFSDVPAPAGRRRARRPWRGRRLLRRVSAGARRGAAVMDIAAGLIQGFAVALQPANLLWCFVGVLLGTVGVLGLMLVAPPLARFALAFSAPEYFALMAFGLSMVVLLAGRSMVKALLATLVGLWIAGIGTDLFTSTSRFTFGRMELLSGIDFVVVAFGIVD